MKIARTIHVGSQMVFGPAAQVAPDIKLQAENGDEAEAWLLGFIDKAPDGSADGHFFLLDPGGKEKLVQHLTGGIVVPSR